MSVNPGELNKRIEIYILSGTDPDGYPINAETLIHSCWAKFSRTSGTEMAKSNADFSTVKVRFLIRYTKKELSRKMIVKYSGRTYEIEYINDYEDRHEYVEIWCSEVTTSG